MEVVHPIYDLIAHDLIAALMRQGYSYSEAKEIVYREEEQRQDMKEQEYWDNYNDHVNYGGDVDAY